MRPPGPPGLVTEDADDEIHSTRATSHRILLHDRQSLRRDRFAGGKSQEIDATRKACYVERRLVPARFGRADDRLHASAQPAAPVRRRIWTPALSASDSVCQDRVTVFSSSWPSVDTMDGPNLVRDVTNRTLNK